GGILLTSMNKPAPPSGGIKARHLDLSISEGGGRLHLGNYPFYSRQRFFGLGMGGHHLDYLQEALFGFAHEVMGAIEIPQMHKMLDIPGVDLGGFEKRLPGPLLPSIVGVADQRLPQEKMVPRIRIVAFEGLFTILNGVVVVLRLEILAGFDEE